MATDEELLSAWGEGDRKAGDALIRRYFDGVTRVIASAVGSEVEELVQQTFARLTEAKSRVHGTNVRAFVFGIVRNVLREHYRRGSKRPGDIEEYSVVDLSPGPSTLRWRRKEDELLAQCLRGLPLRSQLAVEMVYWEGLTIREVATALEVPEGTIASRLRRAKTWLRGCMDGSTALAEVGSEPLARDEPEEATDAEGELEVQLRSLTTEA